MSGLATVKEMSARSFLGTLWMIRSTLTWRSAMALKRMCAAPGRSPTPVVEILATFVSWVTPVTTFRRSIE